MDDLISRKAAIDAIEEYADRLQIVDWKENPGVPYKAYALNWCINTIRDLPSAQPEKHTQERTETHACDLIDRQAAISAMEDVDWYHINKDGQLTHGANSKEDEPLYKAEDVYKVLNDVPSAQPEPCGDVVSRNAIVQKLNEMDRYVSTELRLCDTDKKFPQNEVFIVDDVYEEIVEQLPSAQPDTEKICARIKAEAIKRNVEYMKHGDRYMLGFVDGMRLARCIVDGTIDDPVYFTLSGE